MFIDIYYHKINLNAKYLLITIKFTMFNFGTNFKTLSIKPNFIRMQNVIFSDRS